MLRWRAALASCWVLGACKPGASAAPPDANAIAPLTPAEAPRSSLREEGAASTADSQAPRHRTSTTAVESARPISPSLAAQSHEPVPVDRGAEVVLDPPTVSGGVMGDIDPALRRFKAGLRACYLRWLEEEEEQSPSPSSLTLRIAVASNGGVRSVRIEGASDAAALGACMSRRVEVATFAPPVGGAAEVVVALRLLAPGRR